MHRNEFNISKNHVIYLDNQYNSMPLMKGHKMVTAYLDALHAVVSKALDQYRRVFAFRFDLRLPADTDLFSNSVVSRFIESLKAKIRHNRATAKELQPQVHDTKFRYFWVREIGDSGRAHYHFVVLLNGNAFNWLGSYHSSEGNMATRIWEAWASALGETVGNAKPLVHFPDNPSYILFRGDQESVAVFFRRASYLCKAKTKQYGAGHHGYGSSRT